MALETVLLALLGAVALWLAVDAGRERHRLRARMRRAAARPDRPGAPRPVAGPPAPRAPGTSSAAWRYWPLTATPPPVPAARTPAATPHRRPAAETGAWSAAATTERRG